MLVLKLWYLLYFGSASCLNPFLNLIFRRAGLSEQQVGTIAALRPWVGLFCGAAFAGIADKWRIHRFILLATYVLSSIIRLSVASVTSFAAILTIMLLAAAINSPVTIIADAAAIAACPKEGEYGRQRLWGAVGWGTMSFVSGASQKVFGSWVAFVLTGLLSLGTLFPGLKLPWAPLHAKLEGQHHHHAVHNNHNIDSEEEENVNLLGKMKQTNTLQELEEEELNGRSTKIDGSYDNNNTEVVLQFESDDLEHATPALPHKHPRSPSSPTTIAQVDFGTKLLALGTSPEALLFFILVTILGIAVGTIESFLFLYLEDLGGSETLMGLTLTVTCIAETWVFYFAGSILRKLGLVRCFHLCFLAFLIRLGSYATLAHWGSPWAVLPIELLHGITFGLTWSAGTAMSAAIAPPGLEATTQSAFQGFMFGLGYGIGALVSGTVYRIKGPIAVFIVAFTIVAVGWIVTTFARVVLKKFGFIDGTPARSGKLGEAKPLEVEIL